LITTGSATYLLADQLGSIRATISSSGPISGTANYDAWGNPDTTGGLTSTTPYGYAGGYTDPVGLIYLVHRYYDPATGQFLTVDRLVDQTEAPYAYVNGDPVDLLDPLGLSIGGWIKSKASDAYHGATDLNPWSPNNPIRRFAASGSPAAAPLKLLSSAISPYFAEARAAESGCSNWQVAEYGAAGVIALGVNAVGGEERVAGEAALEGGVRLFRAVSEDEAADITATGTYRIAGSSSQQGKYFFPTAEQAKAFVDRGWAAKVTSATFPRAAVDTAYKFSPGTEGQAYFVSKGFFPHGPVEFLGG
jgi:RHS repeat-associated protein